jgi:hypothetical protein
MKVDLQIKPERRITPWNPVRCDTVQWSKGLPFAWSLRGRLVHRVRRAGSILYRGEWHHDYAHCWCSMSMCEPVFGDMPPVERLLCAICEGKAIAAGEKPASELAGRHVCIGTLKVQRMCCRNETN